MAVGSKEADVLFHRRKTRRLQKLGARARRDVPHAHRAETNRRSRRSKASRWNWALRPPVLFELVAARIATRQPRCGQRSAAVVESLSNLRRLRSTHVLSALRARVLSLAA